MKEIELTNNKYAIVDDDIYEDLILYSWYASFGKGGSVYARRSVGRNKKIIMHRQIVNAKEDEEVIHINRDTLDNRLENLQVCERVNVTMTKSKHKNGITSLYKGVRKRWKKFNARIMNIDLGSFKTEKEAAIAYDKKAVELYGKFANLNFPIDKQNQRT